MEHHEAEPTLPAADQAETYELRQGTTVGRYTVLGLLGMGGMGVVYAAFDAQLDRKVALKFLRDGERGDATDRERGRLLREAQALARLSHPNVLTIHDVGEHARRVFLAMEFVDGLTLGQALAPRDLPLERVVALFAAAGEGLAAAHAAGLVHRDFKPDNVMVGRDGRVRVMDFGLARPGGMSATPQIDARLAATGEHSRSQTRGGGTPAYMPPEQRFGLTVDERSDQFAFCVALWEALHGAPPFDLSTSEGLIAEGAPRVPAGARVPASLQSVLVRGLAADPNDRWPSMRALLDALLSPPSRRRGTLLAIAAAALGVGGVMTWHLQSRAAQLDACAQTAAAIDDAWNAGTAASIRAALVATGLGHAETTAAKLIASLDASAQAWSQASERACLAHAVHGTLTDEAFALRNACLEDARGELEALGDLASGADRAIANRAMRLAPGPETVSSCEDDARLARQAVAYASGSHGAVAEVRRQIIRSALLDAAGRADQAGDLADSALDQATATEIPALIAEARLRQGQHALLTTAYERAVLVLEVAYFDAGAAGADDLAFEATLELMQVLGVRLTRYDESTEWRRHAQMHLRRLGDQDTLRVAALAQRHGGIELRRGVALPEALAELEQARDIRVRLLGPAHPDVASVLRAIGEGYTQLGAYDEADAVLVEATEIFVDAFGPDAPDVAPMYTTRCNLAVRRGQFEAARTLCERALKIREGALEPDHPDIATSAGALAAVLAHMHEFDGARLLAARAIDIRRRRFGPVNQDLATALNNAGAIERTANRFDAALPLFEESLEIRRKLGHVTDVALSLANIGSTRLDMGDLDAAQGSFEAALSHLEAADLGDHVEAVRANRGLGDVLLARGDANGALVPLERAYASASEREGESPTRCGLRASLARALWDANGDRERAKAIAREALEICFEGDTHDAIVAWLAARTAN